MTAPIPRTIDTTRAALAAVTALRENLMREALRGEPAALIGLACVQRVERENLEELHRLELERLPRLPPDKYSELALDGAVHAHWLTKGAAEFLRDSGHPDRKYESWLMFTGTLRQDGLDQDPLAPEAEGAAPWPEGDDERIDEAPEARE